MDLLIELIRLATAVIMLVTALRSVHSKVSDDERDGEEEDR